MAKSPKKDEPKNYFKPKELKCKATGEEGFDDDFLATLNAIRHECGFSFALSSAYRSPQHPIEARKNKLGAHTTGKAVDILANGEKALEIIRVAQKHGIQRIGIQQKGGGRFIHLDACTEEDGFPTPAIWSY
ncbi:D-Ala-D-Ala carboxypeptidase family metallohydrolase [Neptunomonas phycophila]|uniref:D-Ala-D-Ala carboxypeptidase family metallohydrolase n=1 Tax=Neptunomonas phycophila TaxID=1572645 RepID=UPI0035138225